MNSNERNKIEISRSINNLATATYHFNDHFDISNNSYSITVHLRNKRSNDYKSISKKLYKAINKAITTKQNKRNNKSIGLILNFDIEGTREGIPVIHRYLCPHLHGCIILQKNTIRNIGQNEIIESIEQEILANNSDLKSKIQNVSIKKINDTKGSLLKYLNYASKAENYEGITSQLKQTTFIYPYENKIEKANFIAAKLHVNDKQKEQEMNDIGSRIEEISNSIATKPIKIFGEKMGRNIINEYTLLYSKSHDGQKPANLNILYSFMAHLVKSDTAIIN